MTYKDTLFFIAQCLTINHEPKNYKLVKQTLEQNGVNWDAIVKISTEQLVFPALYCNLKKADFLNYLPEDLVDYMAHITQLNRERNQEIIIQAKQLNTLLLQNNITPIFLKGTGNLLEGLYTDIAERMVGDIDFIVSKDNYQKAATLLLAENYTKVHQESYELPSFKHYPRLIKKGEIAAVEVHKELLIESFAEAFNYTIISKDTLQKNEVAVMSYSNQLCLSIAAKQINDAGLHFKNMSLRNAYDVFLLSKKTNAKAAFNAFAKLRTPLNCFLATCFEVFGKIESLDYTKSKETSKYVSEFHKHLQTKNASEKQYKKVKKRLFLKSRFTLFYQAIFNKQKRVWLFKRLTDVKKLKRLLK